MTVTSATTRRAPPRRNPETAPVPTATPHATQAPWGMIVLTAAITTVTGYVVLELIKGVHRSIVKRRQGDEDDLTSQNPPKVKGFPQQPMPEFNTHASMRHYSDFAAPMPMRSEAQQHQSHMTDVSTPVGQLRHEIKSVQHNVDARLSRIEQMLVQHYQREAS